MKNLHKWTEDINQKEHNLYISASPPQDEQQDTQLCNDDCIFDLNDNTDPEVDVVDCHEDVFADIASPGDIGCKVEDNDFTAMSEDYNYADDSPTVLPHKLSDASPPISTGNKKLIDNPNINTADAVSPQGNAESIASLCTAISALKPYVGDVKATAASGIVQKAITGCCTVSKIPTAMELAERTCNVYPIRKYKGKLAVLARCCA